MDRAKSIPNGLGLVLDGRLKDHARLRGKQLEAERLVRALCWKKSLDPRFPLVVCFMGGTGTGKSTLFNSLAGARISAVGMRRPLTVKPVTLVHHDWAEQIAEFPSVMAAKEAGVPGSERDVELSVHRRPELAHIVLVDTPDFDSIELANRAIADELLILSDMVIFVTSQEKYADLVGLQVLQRLRQWEKKTLTVMNKVTSDSAFEGFLNALDAGWEGMDGPVSVERVPSSPELIAGLPDRPEFAELLAIGGGSSSGVGVRAKELGRLQGKTLDRLVDLEHALKAEVLRIESVNDRIRGILNRVSMGMETRLDSALSDDVQFQVQDRLQSLLKKYDIFFTPRKIVSDAIKSAFRLVFQLFSGNFGRSAEEDSEAKARTEDLEAARGGVRLDPLEQAVARLNLDVAGLLSDPALEDLCNVAKKDVPRWGQGEIRSEFDKEFPGVEKLLENEFERLRGGLSRTDEVKLYGSYTLWALLLLTAEIVVGGHFSLLDALLSTAVVPFIPKLVLSQKVLDLLIEIGGRIDKEYRSILRKILERQADLYIRQFRGMLPDEEAMSELAKLKKELISECHRGLAIDAKCDARSD